MRWRVGRQPSGRSSRLSGMPSWRRSRARASRPSCPSILQPADIFLDSRARTSARVPTSSPIRRCELCLRPDLTVPTCRPICRKVDPRREARLSLWRPGARFKPRRAPIGYIRASSTRPASSGSGRRCRACRGRGAGNDGRGGGGGGPAAPPVRLGISGCSRRCSSRWRCPSGGGGGSAISSGGRNSSTRCSISWPGSRRGRGPRSPG